MIRAYKGPLIATAVVLAAVVIVAMGTRFGWWLSDNDRLGDAIRFALPHDAAQKHTTLDLAEVVDGEWDRAVIACRGMDFGEVRRAMGVGESVDDDTGLQTASVVLYFMKDDDVARTYNRDGDIMAEPVYFDPCVRGSRLGKTVSEPIVLTRDDAQLSMVLDARDSFVWVLAE